MMWLVTPRRPPCVVYPYPEEGKGPNAGWWAVAKLDEWYLYYEGRRESFMP